MFNNDDYAKWIGYAEVIHAPGEAPDHICLLDRADRVLFCGDILLDGPVWTHLEWRQSEGPGKELSKADELLR